MSSKRKRQDEKDEDILKGDSWEHLNLTDYASNPHITKDMVVDAAEEMRKRALHDMKKVRERLEQAQERLEQAQERLYQSQERLLNVLDKRPSQTEPSQRNGIED